jgi:hypothetical protein
MIDKLLNLISSRLGLDHDRVLGSRYSFPLLARYLSQCGKEFLDSEKQAKLLYWYIHTFLWGRYAGSTETILNQDLKLIENMDGALDRLLQKFQQDRGGNLRLSPDDFKGWSQSARFYPLLYMLTRVYKARDWGTGIELSKHLLGHECRLELHHIFPKSFLYEKGYQKAYVNAIANFTFLTAETNKLLSNKNPDTYLEEIIQKHPGAVESHWIPTERNLWKVENYLDFLAERRRLLAEASNEFLDSLVKGAVPEIEMIPGGIASAEEEKLLRECNDWIVAQGLPAGEIMYELADPDTGQPLAVIDLAWPNGLQEGLSQPVALLIDEVEETEEIVKRMGYRYFNNYEDLKNHIIRNVLAIAENRGYR